MKSDRRICFCRKAAAALIFLASLPAAARDFYVNADPAKASDDYDGTAPEWAGGDSKTGPKLTLQGAMEIPGLTSGDMVHAAAGV